MYLKKVDSKDYEHTIQKTLKTIVSNEELEDIKEGINLELEEGSYLYSIRDEKTIIGFIVITPLSNEELENRKVDILSVDEIYIQSGKHGVVVAETLARGVLELRNVYEIKQVDIIISQSESWIGDVLQDNGFICVEIKLEKILPTPNNLADVLELIRDCTPIDRIVQVLLEKEEEFRAEILEDIEEIEELLVEGWIPVIVIVTYEPESLKVQDIVDKSNQIIKWDDYSLVYRSEE